GQSEGPKGTDETGEEHDIEIGEYGVERTGQADAQDLPEERPLPAYLREGEPHETTARAQICEQDYTSERVIDQERHAGPGNAQGRPRPPAKYQPRRETERQGPAADDDSCWEEHVARAAHDARQRVEEP